MYALLLLLSVLAGAIGVFTIGFGISVFQSSFGNSLIVAGSVAVVGGMVMLGLAAAVRQLRRIADGMGPRPVVPAARRQPMPEPAESAPAPRRAPGPSGPPIPYPPRPDMREPRPEMRPPPTPALEAPEPPPMERPTERPMERPAERPVERPLERPRPNIFGVARAVGEPPVVDEPETVPLAPNRMPAAPVGRSAPPPMPEPEQRPMPEARQMPEPRPASPADIMARLSNLAAAPPRPSPPPRPEPPRTPPASERPPEQRQRPNMFDALWPAEGRAGRQSQPETIARAPKSEPKPEPRQEPRGDLKPDPMLDIRSEPKPEARPELRFEPPMPRERIEPARERMEPVVNVAPREPMAPPPEQRPIAILKSGVIDGMAYTLYTDGSIEAELPQGTMRFGSIDELRAHLENTEPRD
jgi:hypothetical protein